MINPKVGRASPRRLMRQNSRASFTLIELLIVIAIVTILAVVVVLVLNPAELLRQARDSNRLSDIDTLNKAIAFFQVDVSSGSFGNSSTTYLSLVDPTATTTAGTHCQGIPLTPPSGWTYRCAASSTQRRVDGTGWVPVNFTQISSGAPLSALPVDPVNTSSSGQYYSYTSGGSWALSALLESQRYLKQAALDDGGYDPGRYEKGDNLSLQAKAEGLVGWWRLDESSGTLADSSGNGNTGTQSGGVTYGVSGKIGTALSFDGVNDYVNILNSISLGSNWTITAWIKTTTSGQVPIASNRGLGGNIYFGMVSGKAFLFENPCVPAGFITNASVNNNTFHFYTFVRTGSPMIGDMYIDGMLDKSTSPTSCTSESGSWRIGHDVANGTEYFPGIVDDVRIYSRPLSAAEIKAIYDATK